MRVFRHKIVVVLMLAGAAVGLFGSVQAVSTGALYAAAGAEEETETTAAATDSVAKPKGMSTVKRTAPRGGGHGAATARGSG